LVYRNSVARIKFIYQLQYSIYKKTNIHLSVHCLCSTR